MGQEGLGEAENDLVSAEASVATETPAEKPRKKREKAAAPEPAPVVDEVGPSVRAANRLPVQFRSGPHVYQAISEVKAILAKTGGITKEREAAFGERYKFRGIDDMYNVLCGVTSNVGLVMIPRVIDSRIEREERASGKGMQTHIWLTVEVDFISTHDGTKHTGCFVGEAIDTSDKASNKAISAAFKYAHLTVFQIPTHGESDDTENYSHEVTAPVAPKPELKVTAAVKHMGPKLENGTPMPALDSSDATNVALGQKIAVSDSFLALLEMAKEADPRPEPGRGVIFQKVYSRSLELIQASKSLKELQEAKGLIQALGQPAPLLACYNGRYAALRSVPMHTPES